MKRVTLIVLCAAAVAISGCEMSGESVEALADHVATGRETLTALKAEKVAVDQTLSTLAETDARYAPLARRSAELGAQIDQWHKATESFEGKLRDRVASGESPNALQVVGDGLTSAAPATGPIAGYVLLAGTLLSAIGNVIQRVQKRRLEEAAVSVIASIEAAKKDGKVDFVADAETIDSQQTPAAKRLVDQVQDRAEKE